MVCIAAAIIITTIIISNGGDTGSMISGAETSRIAANANTGETLQSIAEPEDTADITANAAADNTEGQTYTVLPGQYPITEEEITMLAKLIWGEARGVKSTTQKAAVVWCVLNRVDADEFPDTITEVVLQKKQFIGYNEDYPATEEHIEIVTDVIDRWNTEKVCTINVGRVLPQDYKWFTGDGKVNYFTNGWNCGDTWDWSAESPYDS